MSSNADRNTAAMACLWQQLADCSMLVMLQPVTRGLPCRVERRLGGTKSVGDEADRRRRRAATSVLKWRNSARYDGAVPWRHRYARTHNRNLILSGTLSQWSSWSSGVSLPRWEDQPSSGVQDWLQSVKEMSRCSGYGPSCSSLPCSNQYQQGMVWYLTWGNSTNIQWLQPWPAVFCLCPEAHTAVYL